MARSSTTAQPGNQLAVTHGAYSAELVAAEVPAMIERLFEQMPWLIEADQEGVRSFAGVCVQEKRLQEWMDADPDGRGSLFTTRGGVKKVASLWKEIQHSKREWMKILAMGPGPRSQYAQAMSGAGKNMVEVRSGLKSLNEELRTPVLRPQDAPGSPETPSRDS